MKKRIEVVQRIESQYVGDDCAQIMFPYKKFMTLANKDGILFYTQDNSITYINKYLEDQRREQFPYSTIPTHRQFNGLEIYNHVNQILEFEQPYIRIGDTGIFEHFVVKDGPTALALTKVMPSIQTTKIVTRKELEEMLDFRNIKENNYSGLNIYGYLQTPLEEINIPNEEELIEYIKSNLEDELNQCVNEGSLTSSRSNALKKIIQYSDLASLEFHVPLNPYFVITYNGQHVYMTKIIVTYIGIDRYEINTKTFQTSTYALEHLKLMTPKIVKTKEPSIPRFLNREIPKQDILLAKKRVRTKNPK